jgi:hypothetical protein
MDTDILRLASTWCTMNCTRGMSARRTITSVLAADSRIMYNIAEHHLRSVHIISFNSKFVIINVAVSVLRLKKKTVQLVLLVIPVVWSSIAIVGFLCPCCRVHYNLYLHTCSTINYK